SAVPPPNAPTAADTATPTAPSVPTPAAPTTPAAPPPLRPPPSPAIENDAVAKDEEGVLVIHSGHSRMMFDAGDRLPSQSGDYIYFQHNGKPYLIQDPQIIAKAQALLAPIKPLRDQQKLLGDQQSVLGA